MNFRMTAVATLAALAWVPPLALAAGSPGLYVVPGVFFSDATQGDTAAASSKINPNFRSSLDMAAESALVQQIAQTHFPGIVPTIDKTNRQRTLALSVQVSRASLYEITKSDGTTDLYQPITLSTYISNPLTGEVLQSFAQTRYSIQTVSGDTASSQNAAKIRSAFHDGFEKLLNDVLTQASANFKPYVVEATAADTWKGYVILNKGFGAGIGKGDILDSASSEVRVEYAGEHYAVAVPVLGSPTSGDVFSRPTTMALSEVRKPRVITLVSGANPDLAPAVSTQLFADQLGSNATFSTLPLNSNYSQVQSSIDTHTQIGHQVSANRSLPDYFIRLVLPAAAQYALPTNLSYKTQQVTQAWAYAELASRDGRVLYAADVADRVNDTVTDGSGFDGSDRREIVLKNALTGLADRFTKEVHFEPVSLKLADASSDTFKVNDPGTALPVGASFRVYHDIGHVSGVPEDVLVPTWDATVSAHDNSTAVALTVLPVAGKPPRPDSGDVVVMNSIANTAAGGQRTAFCPAEKSQFGVVGIEHFDELAYVAAARTHLFLVDPQIATLVEGKVTGQSGFSADLHLQPPTHDRCLVAMYRIDAPTHQCDSGVCTDNFKVRLGYQFMQNGQVASQTILQHSFSASGYPEQTSADTISTLLGLDLSTNIRTNLDAVIAQLLQKGS
jgi:hypothetical protein